MGVKHSAWVPCGDQEKPVEQEEALVRGDGGRIIAVGSTGRKVAGALDALACGRDGGRP